jgi:ABC-type transport system involved in multi-copper enzyme maturation permease subunit
MLPIVRRELAAAARHPKLYRSRLWAGMAETVIAALLFLSRGGRAPGGGFFFSLSLVALVFCLLDGLRKAADSISEENREGTLGLLFLGGLGGTEIVLGKFAASLVRSINSLLAFLPILAIALLFGGTTGGEFWRIVLVLSATLAASTAISLLVSAISRDESTGWAFGSLLLWCAAPPLLAAIARYFHPGSSFAPLRNLSPVTLFHAAADSAYLISRVNFWSGLGGVLLLSAASLFLAGRIIPHAWQNLSATGGKPILSRTKKETKAAARRLRRRELLDANPFYWLAFDPASHRRFMFALILVCSLGALALVASVAQGPRFTELAGVTGMLSGAILLLSATRMARQASNAFMEARRSGLLQLALTTPLSPAEILKGHWLALRKTIVPAAACFLVLLLIFLCGLRKLNTHALWSVKYFLEGIFELYVLGWVGAWMGLAAKSPGRAYFGTIVIGIIAPYLVCTPTLLNQLLLVRYARDKVRFGFRALLGDRYSATDPISLSGSPLSRSNAPPVIR